MVVVSSVWRLVAVAALGVGSASMCSAQDAPLTGEEIKAAWADKEVSGRTVRSAQFWMSLKSDGSASIAVGNLNDTGQWRPTDNGYCAKWNRIREGKEACFTVRRSMGSYVVFNDDGSENARVHNVR